MKRYNSLLQNSLDKAFFAGIAESIHIEDWYKNESVQDDESFIQYHGSKYNRHIILTRHQNDTFEHTYTFFVREKNAKDAIHGEIAQELFDYVHAFYNRARASRQLELFD